jgi:hypothetical protein
MRGSRHIHFFQGPDEAGILGSGARAVLGTQPAPADPGRGVAPIEGSER